MEQISVFDILKIGVGPSSSHTMGPWVAALRFLDQVDVSLVVDMQIKLYGSLAKTGRGHGTDIAVMLGLMGYDPKTIKTKKINKYIQTVYDKQLIELKGQFAIPFLPEEHLVFVYKNFEKKPILHKHDQKLLSLLQVVFYSYLCSNFYQLLVPL